MLEFGQSIVDGLSVGSIYAIIGISAALVLGTTGRFHFAFATTFTLAAYVTSVLISNAIVAWPLAAAVGVLSASALGVTVEALVYRPIERRAVGDSAMPIFVASLGVTIVGENVTQLIWSSDQRTLTAFASSPVRFDRLVTQSLDIIILVIAVLLSLALSAILRWSSLGRQIKAVRVNPEMARAVGINVRQVFLTVFAIGSAIAAVAAILQGMKFAVVPNMGTDPLLYGFVVAFLAGTRSDPIRVGLCGLVVGLIQNVSTLWVSQQLSIVAVFGVLIGFLAYRSLSIALLRHSQTPPQLVLAALRRSRHPTQAQAKG